MENLMFSETKLGYLPAIIRLAAKDSPGGKGEGGYFDPQTAHLYAGRLYVE